VGYLEQEPPLDETKTVKENIERPSATSSRRSTASTRSASEMADPDADFDALMDEMGKLQNEIDAVNGWDLDSQLSQAMDALQCPDPDDPVEHLSGGERRRVALCKLLLEAPDLLLLDEPDQPPGCRIRAVAGAVPEELPGRGAGRHARPLLPGQRRGVDLRGRPRSPLPVQGQLLHLPGDEGEAPRRAGQQDARSAPRR
jgi:hypothetical protein